MIQKKNSRNTTVAQRRFLLKILDNFMKYMKPYSSFKSKFPLHHDIIGIAFFCALLCVMVFSEGFPQGINFRNPLSSL